MEAISHASHELQNSRLATDLHFAIMPKGVDVGTLKPTTSRLIDGASLPKRPRCPRREGRVREKLVIQGQGTRGGKANECKASMNTSNICAKLNKSVNVST